MRGETPFLFYQEGERVIGGERHSMWRSFFYEVREFEGEPWPQGEIVDMLWMPREAMRAHAARAAGSVFRTTKCPQTHRWHVDTRDCSIPSRNGPSEIRRSADVARGCRNPDAFLYFEQF